MNLKILLFKLFNSSFYLTKEKIKTFAAEKDLINQSNSLHFFTLNSKLKKIFFFISFIFNSKIPMPAK